MGERCEGCGYSICRCDQPAERPPAEWAAKVEARVLDPISGPLVQLTEEEFQDIEAILGGGVLARIIEAVAPLREAEREKKLVEALKALWGYIEGGQLVRNTTFDYEHDWAIKQMKFVTNLKQAESLLREMGEL